MSMRDERGRFSRYEDDDDYERNRGRRGGMRSSSRYEDDDDDRRGRGRGG